MTYPIEVAGLKRELPICKVTDDLYIGAVTSIYLIQIWQLICSSNSKAWA